jgi:predicted GNAT family N-acyltransferase
MDAKTVYVLDQAAHFSLLTKFGFKFNGTLYCRDGCGHRHAARLENVTVPVRNSA